LNINKKDDGIEIGQKKSSGIPIISLTHKSGGTVTLQTPLPKKKSINKPLLSYGTQVATAKRNLLDSSIPLSTPKLSSKLTVFTIPATPTPTNTLTT